MPSAGQVRNNLKNGTGDNTFDLRLLFVITVQINIYSTGRNKL